MNALAPMLPNLPTLEQIQSLERALLACPEHVEIRPVHHFAPGVYCREITIPAGVVVVGKLHRTHHIIMLLAGDVTIYTDEGMQRIVAPRVWHTSPGTKRAIYAHVESKLLTVHPTTETDLALIEAAIIEPEPVPVLEQEDAA